jgi:hypothetical protein
VEGPGSAGGPIARRSRGPLRQWGPLRQYYPGLVAATDIYPHGVLGDPLEGTAVELLDQETGVRSRIQIDPPSVIEGISPIRADLGGDGEAEVLVTISNGEVEVIDVLTPHIGGVVEYSRLVDDHLVRLATAAEFMTHVLGTANLDMGIVADGDGDGHLDVIVSTQDRRSLTVLTRRAQGVEGSAPKMAGSICGSRESSAAVEGCLATFEERGHAF